MLSRRTAWQVAIVATLTMTVSYVDRTTFSVLAPAITKDLGISNEQYGWLVSAFSIAYLFGTPLAGWWIDLIGARRGLVISVLAWSAVAALHAVAPGLAALLVLRILLGLTEGPGFPGAAQTMQRILPPGDRERGFGVLFTGSSFGTMIVAPAAAALFAIAGWRYALLLTTLGGLIWIPLWLWVTRRADVRAQLELAEERSTEPRPRFAELVRNPIMVRALLAILSAAPMFGFAPAWGAKYFVATFHISQADVGHYLWIPPLLLDVAAIGFGDLASRQRRGDGVPPRALVAIATAMTAAVALLPLASSPAQGIAIMAVGLGGSGAVYALVTADLLARIPRSSTSFAGGVLAGAQSVALIVSNPLVGWAVDWRGNYDISAIAVGLWALPGCIAWLLWRPPARFELRAPLAQAIVRTDRG